MKNVWAKPEMKWNGFKPVPYSLGDRVLELPLTRVRAENDSKDPVPTTLGQILQDTLGRSVEIEDRVSELAITTDSRQLVVSSTRFVLEMLGLLLNLRQEGLKGFEAEWFLFDADSCMTSPHEAYVFFVVCSGKIVRERVSFADYSGSGFDPGVFEYYENPDPTWMHEDARQDAWVKYWYKRFYSETQSGRLMTLRSDGPTLYYCDGPQDPGAIPGQLRKIYVLLGVLAVLAVLSLILRLK